MPLSKHFPRFFTFVSKNFFMVTVPLLKRALTVDPNEPRPSSSSLTSHHYRIWVEKDFRDPFFGETNGILKVIISGY